MLRASITLVRLALSVRLDPARRNPELVEIATVGDSAVRVAVYVRAFTDSAAAFDAINSRAFGKALADTATLTDDVGGAASADDDQTMQFFKNVVELSWVTEAQARAGTKPFADAFAITDSAAKAVGWLPTDATTIADSAARVVQFARSPSEAPTVSDLYARVGAFSRAFAHGGAAADAGLAAMQDYTSDATYFAADYVGIARTF
jgi:hypothetical protein